MELLLDGERLSLAAGTETLAQALRLGIETARSRGLMVVEATADGQPLDESVMERGTAATLSLRTAHPGKLARETLLQAAETMETVRAHQQKCGEALGKGDESGGIDHLRVALEGWQMVRDVIDQTRALVGKDWKDVVVFGTHGEATVDHAIEQLAIALKAIKATSEAQDWSGLSDIVMYDMDALAEVFVSLLRALAERAHQP